MLGGLLFLIAGAMLFQQLTRTDLGIDLKAFHLWLSDPNPAPGRMASNTALAFLLSGMAFMLRGYGDSRTVLRTIETFAFLVVFIGLTGAMGYALKLEFLYSWFQYTHMALYTAVGVIVLGIGLWSVWLQLPAAQRSLQYPTENRIVGISALLFFTIALIAGLVGFASMQQRTEKTLQDGLRRSLQNRSDLFITAVSETSMATRLIATRLSLQQLLGNLNTDPGNAREIARLTSAAKSFLPMGFSAVAFHDKRGHESRALPSSRAISTNAARRDTT